MDYDNWDSLQADVLTKLKDMKVQGVPEIVLNGCCNGRTYFVESFLEGLPLEYVKLSIAETLSKKLEWMKTFYRQTLEGTIEPRELIRRAEEVCDLASEMIDLTYALSTLDKFKPATKIPSVCRHGDITDDNFIIANGRIMAIDFGCARFNEPPCEPYALVSPFVLNNDARSLDLLSSLKDVNPLFLFTYENILTSAGFNT